MGAFHCSGYAPPIASVEMPLSGKRILLSAFVVLFCRCLPTSCIGGDAVFSKDGQRIYTLSFSERSPAVREIDLTNQTSRIIPLTQLAANDPPVGITRSEWDKFPLLTRKSIWAFDPRSGRLAKVREASKNGNFYRIAYDPKSRQVFVTASGEGGPLFMLKNGRDLVPVFVRRHDAISSPVFTADGEFFYSETGDLWSGEIESEEGRLSLSADRYAPLAYLETANTTPNGTGVSDIAVARDAIYVQLFRMGGSGWGVLLQLARPPRPTKHQTVSSMADLALKELARQKEVLQGVKSLGEDNQPACLCASPDESRVYYTNERKDYLITNGQTQELHLKEINASARNSTPDSAAAVPSPEALNESQEAQR
jgi:hypothetical protein